MAESAGPAPAGPSEREGAERLLDAREADLDAEAARAFGAAAIGGSAAEAARALRELEGALGARFRAMDPEDKVGLAAEFEAGVATFKRRCG
jgi:hypothetical protein